MNLNKNEEYIVDIIDNGYEGEGIAKIDNLTIFIPNAIKGEKVKIIIVKVLSSHAYGKIIEIIETSKRRVPDDCSTYKRCGGCNLRHIEYQNTLEIKRDIVKNCIYKSLNKEIVVNETLGMEEPYYYRNKLQFPLGYNKENKSIMGIYANRSHEIIPIKDKCYIQNEQTQSIAKDIYEFIINNNISIYNEKILKGLVRHIVIKIGIKTNEIMLILVVNKKELPHEKELINLITQKYSNIKTIVKNINTKNTNVILGNTNEIIYGDGYIYDLLGEYRFKISAMSFYQVNPIQTEKLYKTAVEYADLKGDEIAFDLYCGIGTIAIFMSKFVKKVYGIETIPQAIEDAKENAVINNINNVEFLVGNVEEVLPELIGKEKIEPDVIFVDPPRKGLDDITINTILKLKPKKVIYISCNPATLARDLKKLEELYDIKKVQPVDMFPFSSHIENVCSLKLK